MIEIKCFKDIWEYKTFIKFLKKEKIYHIFLLKKYDIEYLPSLFENAFKSVRSFSDLALEFTNISKETIIPSLVYSQLWRFFVLEEMEDSQKEKETIHIHSYDSLKKRLLEAIKANGHRDNDRVKKLFDKHKIVLYRNE